MFELRPTAFGVGNVLGGYRLPVGNEAELQRAIANAFKLDGIAFEREVARGADRIDFVVGRVGIEVKVKGTLTAVTRQLFRYAAWDSIDELLCVTTIGVHKKLPDELNGKPLHVQLVRGMF